MRSRTLYRCPHLGCSQTSTRRWNINVHIKRRHGGSNNLINAPSVPTSGIGFVPLTMDSPLTYGGFSPSPYNYGHKTYHQLSMPFNAQLSQRNAEVIKDPILNIRRFNEDMRVMATTKELLTKNTISNTPQSLLMALVASNFFQGNHATPVKNTRIATGYRIWVCDKCGAGPELQGVFHPIEFEGLTKPLHGCYCCDTFCESGPPAPDLNSPEQSILEDILTQAVFSRIGQGDAYLKVGKISAEAFAEERRQKINLAPDRSLIEEKDCIDIKILSKDDKAHWSYSAIKQCSNSNKIRLTIEEVKDFLNIARSTFAIFRLNVSNSAKKEYFLMYLSF